MNSLGILGNTGFIGQNLVDQLDNSVGISLRNSNWINLIEDKDILINLIGKAHDHNGDSTLDDYCFANVILTKEVFEGFLASKAHLLIHISSLAAVEELESNKPICESDLCRPISWYGKTKREAEIWLLSQKLPYNKKLIIVRPPMVHGPGDKGNLSLLFKLISKGIPYPLAAYDNKRSFIGIDNFIFFLRMIIEHKTTISSGIYHIADDEVVSTNDLIKLIGSVTGRKVYDFRVPKFFINSMAKLGDIFPIPLNTKRLKKMTSNLLLSNSKIKKELGIHKLPLTAEEGLLMTIKSMN